MTHVPQYQGQTSKFHAGWKFAIRALYFIEIKKKTKIYRSFILSAFITTVAKALEVIICGPCGRLINPIEDQWVEVNLRWYILLTKLNSYHPFTNRFKCENEFFFLTWVYSQLNWSIDSFYLNVYSQLNWSTDSFYLNVLENVLKIY